MDGLYEIRYGDNNGEVDQTDDFWNKINDFLDNSATSISSGTKAGLQALKLDDACVVETVWSKILN